MRYFSKPQGITLIEGLIFGGLVGIIGLMAGLAVGEARSMQRDVVRVSNVRQVQAALENHFNDHAVYPGGSMLPLGDPTQSACLGDAGFSPNCQGDEQVYLRSVVGSVGDGLEQLSVCGAPPRNAFCYSALQDATVYQIQFELENSIAQTRLREGVNCASPTGIEPGPC